MLSTMPARKLNERKARILREGRLAERTERAAWPERIMARRADIEARANAASAPTGLL